MKDPNKDLFLRAADDWVCSPYLLEIRYIARKVGEEIYLMSASIGLAPLPLTEHLNFSIEANGLYAGQVQLTGEKENILGVLKKAADGELEAHGHVFRLRVEHQYNYYSDSNYKDQWFYDLHLKITGDRDQSLPAINVSSVDNALRKCSMPFDGLSDLSRWLGLSDNQLGHDSPSINIRVLTPVDLMLTSCRLARDRLDVVLNAHPAFGLDRLGLAVLAFPGNGTSSRRQVAAEIKWKKRANKGRREGVASIPLKDAGSALAMLLIGETTVRRHWFLDPVKGDNNRLKAVQHFDKDLQRIKLATLEPTDANRFEMGVAALLFLMGFSSAVQLETDSPDIVATTPGGKLVLVECTTKIADFNSKLGKLVDRKGALARALQESKNPSRVEAVLVCALPKEQVAVHSEVMQAHLIILVTKEELTAAFDQLRFHVDPDKFIDDGLAQLARSNLLVPNT